MSRHHYDAVHHVRGDSLYVDDVTPPEGMLHAAVVGSQVAHGRLVSVDASAALALDGVVAVLTAADIPGENQIGAIIPDEVLLAEDTVSYIGHPVALVLAEDVALARRAVAHVKVELPSSVSSQHH